MNIPHTALAIAMTLSIAAPLAYAQDAPPKLYHWVSADGKDHYSDDLPPEALNQARQEISKTGVTLKQVERAQTAEEKTAAEAKAAADAKVAELLEKAKQTDQVLLSSYPTEAELKRAYADRFDQQTESLKTIQIELESQQQSLIALLNAASNLELTGEQVNADLARKILIVHMQILGQQKAQVQQQAQTASLRQESAAEIARYRRLRAAAESADATDKPAAPDATSPAIPPKG